MERGCIKDQKPLSKTPELEISEGSQFYVPQHFDVFIDPIPKKRCCCFCGYRRSLARSHKHNKFAKITAIR